MDNFFHPSDTRQTIRHSSEIENFALRYTKFLKVQRKDNKYKFAFSESIHKINQSGHDLIEEIIKRQENQLKSLSHLNYFRVIEASVDWRLIIGLGGGHVQETDMTLHHIYGIPYIPGSAIKGALKHWAEDEKQKKELIDKIFGKQDYRGDLIFLDAFPVSEVTLAMDIMNPHYPDYYGGNKYPTDCQNPNPIPFLTIEDTKFRFVFLCAKKNENANNYLDKIVEWLGTDNDQSKGVFQTKGIGAKTAVGYGYFKAIKDKTKEFEVKFIAKEKEIEQQKETERLENLTPADRLYEELKKLTIENHQRSYEIYNNELDKFADDDQIKIANALMKYWQKIDKWEKGSDKQQKKVARIKSILQMQS